MNAIAEKRPFTYLALFLSLSWLGMFVHNMIELPLTLLSPENSLPGLISIALFLGWWLLPAHQLPAWAILGWALLHLIMGGIGSVLPLSVWPFVPEQSVTHYLTHLIYSLTQLPLIALMLTQQRSAREI
jgi:hypothetical protein